jgi:DUF2950 family protein
MKTASVVWVMFCFVAVGFNLAGSEPPGAFPSPTAAMAALVTSIEEDNYQLFISTLGPQMAEVWSTGDAVRDALERERLLDGLRRAKLKEDLNHPNRTILYLGDDGESFPAPLVRSGHLWRFDGAVGSREVAKRRIQRNEVAAIDRCRQYRDAQLNYASTDHDGIIGFAERIRSTPGQQDGLYWSNDGAADESPVGPMFAQAAFVELLPDGIPHPYSGYYFKVLLQQGPDAIGGAMDYRVDGKLLKGFALIAWPAEYGVSGKRSFLVNHRSEVYQQDLGPGTAKLAAAMSTFNPDHGWTRVPANGDDE